jgi:hypothetical protein
MWTHERISRLLIGTSILAGLIIGYFVTPYGYLFLAGTALNLIQFAFTGYCGMQRLLDRLGIPYDRPPEHLLRPSRHVETPMEALAK